MTNVEAINTIRRLPLTVDDFLLLNEHGAFEGYGKTELIRGEIFFMNAQHSRHGRAKMKLANAINAILPSIALDLEVLIEVSLDIEGRSAPIPDVFITSYKGDDLVPSNTVPLVIEIADTTQKNDLSSKSALYAEAQIPEYWVFDLKAGVLHQMWSPGGEAYTQKRQISAGEMITSEAIGGLTIRLPAS
jgi:Uma2 family endonuclease